jgi:hypothetical protein
MLLEVFLIHLAIPGKVVGQGFWVGTSNSSAFPTVKRGFSSNNGV